MNRLIQIEFMINHWLKVKIDVDTCLSHEVCGYTKLFHHIFSLATSFSNISCVNFCLVFRFLTLICYTYRYKSVQTLMDLISLWFETLFNVSNILSINCRPGINSKHKTVYISMQTAALSSWNTPQMSFKNMSQI